MTFASSNVPFGITWSVRVRAGARTHTRIQYPIYILEQKHMDGRQPHLGLKNFTDRLGVGRGWEE